MSLRGSLSLALVYGLSILFHVCTTRADTPLGPARDALDTWFQTHPERRTEPGSGWKPYQRRAWFLETRASASSTHPGVIRAQAMAEAERKRRAGQAWAGSWFNAGPNNYSGRATAIDFHPAHPGTVFVGTPNGGVWRSFDGGSNWTPLTDDLPSLAVGALRVLPWNPNVVLLGTGDGSGSAYGLLRTPLGIGMLKSTDGGQTWNPTSLSYPVSGTHGFNVIAVNPITHTILAGANDGLWRSSDDGDTWIQVGAGGNYFDAVWRPGDPARVYVAKGRDPFLNTQVDNGVFVSVDDGLTFSLAGSGQPSGASIAKTKLAVSAADPDVVYAHFVNASGWSSLGVYRSLDNGQTWQLRNATNFVGGQGWYNLVLAADPDDADRLITGGIHLYTSTNGGAGFVIRSDPSDLGGNATKPHVDQHALAYEPGRSNHVWVACDGGVWRSTNDGVAWQSKREGIISYQYYDICASQTDPLFVVGGTQDNGVPVRDGQLVSWDESNLGGDGGVCNIAITNPNAIYAELQNGAHFWSPDRGQQWFSRNTGISGSGIFITPVAIDPNDDLHLYTMSATSGIYRTTTGMLSWTNVAPHFARWISISPANGDVVWTVSNFSGVWRTTNDGSSWTQSIAFPATGLETKIETHPTHAGTAFVTFGGYGTGSAHVIRTTNFGTTWQDVSGDLPDQPANTLLVDPDQPDWWYVGSDAGVWYTRDQGVTWNPLGDGLPQVVVTDLEMNRSARKLVAGTFGRGVWEIELPLELVGVADPVRPGPLLLDPVRPNPARGPVFLRFGAYHDAPVELSVFDAQGRRIAVVTREARGDGVIRTAGWDPTGRPPGVYFAVLRAGTSSASRSFVVVE